MSTVHALLTMLQDRGKRTPASVRHLLLELASCCRCADAKAAILADGLEPLLALAADDQELPRGETLEVLLELLVLLILDKSKAKIKAARGGALELAVRCLNELSAGAVGSRRRAKILKRALELVDLLSHTTESQQLERQTIVVKQVVEVIKRADEDVTVLVRATDTLGRFIDGSLERIQVAATEQAVAVLINLLKSGADNADLKRTSCEVLILMGEAPGMLQLMAAQNIVSALCICLRMETPAHDVEFAVVRLLLRLAREARVYGQIVHEEMVPLLFQVIERNSNLREVAATSCMIVADLSDFARQCKLDLSPFMESCRGKVLVLAATCHAQDATVVDSTFRFFVNVSNNPVDLPHLINSETIEGLLSLYVLAGGSGYLAELAGHLVHVIVTLSRSRLEQFTIQEEDITLPALFLCLRNYHENARFTSQVFAIMAKHWKTQCQAKSVHSITGYVGIAVEILCRTIPASKPDETQTAEIINFIREMMLAKDGAEVVLSCGGKDLLEVLHTYLPTGEDDPSSVLGTPCDRGGSRNVSTIPAPRSSPLRGGFGGQKLAVVVANLLKNAVLGLAELTAVSATVATEPPATNDNIENTALRPGDTEYDEYVSKLFCRENSSHYKLVNKAERQRNADRSDQDVIISRNSTDSHFDPLDSKLKTQVDGTSNEEPTEHKGHGNSTTESLEIVPDDSSGDDDAEADADNADEENNDDSDDDDDDEDDVGLEKVKSGGDGVEDPRVPTLCSITSSIVQPNPERRNSVSTKFTSSDSSFAHFYDHLEDRRWYYMDSSLVRYPKHPSRMDRERQNNPEEEFVLDDPGFLEPCNLPDAETGARFVEEAIASRAEFIASEVNTRARIVYKNMSMVEDRDKVAGIPPFLMNSRIAQQDAPYFVPEKTKAFPDLSSSLTFDSNFESGNLERAIRVGEYEYDLILRHDFNSSGHMQWFYFAISNIHTPDTSPRGGQKYRFNIVNLCKPNSLFNQGLQPVVYSVRDGHQKGKGWVRSGTDIYYFANSFVRPPRNTTNFQGVAPTEMAPAAAMTAPSMTYYTLTFTLEFSNADDTYLIAHSYPYTLTMHQLHILRSGHNTSQILRHSLLCTTLSGRSCDLLTISDFSVAQQELGARRAVFVTARVHPGESQASWMMRGVIDFLLGNSDVARVLRRMFVFQIIPMLNPDGVYYGNSRCGLSACDLNRQWQAPSKALHPTIFHAKELLVKERSSRGVAFFCDMHGHSRKKNVFMYGCDTKRKPNPAAREFAKLFSMQHIAKKYISFPDCSFKVSKDKETTARVVVANELKISWSFTLEASFCGANYGELQNMHFNTKDLREVGASLCETLFQACVSDVSVRDRLIAEVDDSTVCIPQQVEPYLREAGAVSEGSPVDVETYVNPRSSLNKKTGSGKKTTNEAAPKSVRRKTSKARAVSTSDAGAQKVAETNEGPGRRRRMSRQQNKSSSLTTGILDGTTRDVTDPAFVTDDSTTGLDLAYIPPPKLSGRKLRSKYPKVRRTKSSPVGHVKSRRRAVSSLASNDDADESEEPTSQHATAGVYGAANSYPSTDSIMPLVSPSKLLAVPGLPTSSVRNSFQGPESTYVRSPKSISFPYPSNILGIPLRDSSVLLPSPVGEVITRSPKAPANRIRFRGAGRQFAAVSTIPRASIHGILVRLVSHDLISFWLINFLRVVFYQRSDSVAAFQSYEADLINASTMVIRQRGSIAASNNAPATSDEKNLSSPPSSYLSFPSVI